MGDRRAVSTQSIGAVFLQPGKEIGIAQQAVFHDLRIAAEKLAPRQRRKHFGVGDHHPRLVEQPDEILPVRGVDCGFSPYRGIDLREQGGGYLRKIDAALEDARGEAREIADDPAAKRHDQRAALNILFEQGFDQPFQMGKALGLFTGRQHDCDRDQTGSGDAGGERLVIEARHRLVGDHSHAPWRGCRELGRQQFARLRDETRCRYECHKSARTAPRARSSS